MHPEHVEMCLYMKECVLSLLLILKMLIAKAELWRKVVAVTWQPTELQNQAHQYRRKVVDQQHCSTGALLLNQKSCFCAAMIYQDTTVLMSKCCRKTANDIC